MTIDDDDNDNEMLIYKHNLLELIVPCSHTIHSILFYYNPSTSTQQ